MQLIRGSEAEYIKRHDEIWPELLQLLKRTGIHDYSIFLDEESGLLFALMHYNSEEKLDDLQHIDVMKKWWDYMKDIMETNEDYSPVTKPLKRVFYLP